MSRIFDADNAFFRFMSRVADALILNLFFLITSIPIVTIGASYTAMYYYCTKALGNEEGYLWKSYWKSFKTNFVQGFLMELFFVVVGVILYVDLKYLYGNAFNGGGFGWRLLFFIVVATAKLFESNLSCTCHDDVPLFAFGNIVASYLSNKSDFLKILWLAALSR